MDDKLKEVRRAVADYMASEGCSCCQNIDAHKEAYERLGKLLGVKRYPDSSGFEFYKHRTRPTNELRAKEEAMTHAPKFWAAKLTKDRQYKFWELVNSGFDGETAYCRTLSRTYG